MSHPIITRLPFGSISQPQSQPAGIESLYHLSLHFSILTYKGEKPP